MKAVIFVVCVLLLHFLLTTNAFGEDSKQETTAPPPPSYSAPLIDRNESGFKKMPLNKFTRGIVNISFFWLEVPIEMNKTAKEQNQFVGGTLGLAKGFFAGFLRIATGVVDIATFIIPPYDRPLMEPEYVFSTPDP